MKKIVLGILIAFLILSEVPAVKAENLSLYNKNKFILRGYVISNIPTGDLFSKYGNVMPGLDKVDNAEQLSNDEYTDNANDIPLFAKVNLFDYQITAKKAVTPSELADYYKKTSFTDYYGKESLVSAIVSMETPDKSRDYGGIFYYSTKSGPRVEIAYKKITAGKKTSYIPIRKVVKTNSVITHFLLIPYTKPLNERINRFDFVQVYDVEPCFTSTLYNRQYSGDKTTDFTGFYTDIPDAPSPSYYSLIEESLEKFAHLVHSRNKLLIVENLDKDSYRLGKYGDIIGIRYPGNNAGSFLEKVRKAYPDKIIFATINADLGDKAVLTGILRKLSEYGIYPEFRRDTRTGDFFYYENAFALDSELINRYVKIIETENGFEFIRHFEHDGLDVSEFVNGDSKLYAVSGKGDFELPFPSEKPLNATDLFGNNIALSEGNGEQILKEKIDGFKAFIVKDADSSNILLLGIVPWVSKGSATILFRNFGAKSATCKVTVKSGNKVLYSDSPVFLPLKDHILNVRYSSEPLRVFFQGKVFRFVVPAKHFPVLSFVVLFLLLFLFALYIYVKKKRPIPRILNVKKFILAVFFLPVFLVILNRYFVHYSLHTITFFVFALMYLLLAFYDTEFQTQSIFAFSVMLFLGLLFNFFEFKTLMPHFFTGILPFPEYQMIIYLIPFVFAVLFFGMYGGKKVNKLEILIFILTVGIPAFLWKPFLSPFVMGLNISAFYPVLIPLIGGALLGVFHKKGFMAYLVVFGLFLGIVFLGIFTSIRFYDLIVIDPVNAQMLLIMKDLFLLSLPLYFMLLLHHNIVKVSPKVSLNKIMTVLLTIVIFASYFTQWGIKFLGSNTVERVFAMPSYIVIVFLTSIIMIEPINKKNTV